MRETKSKTDQERAEREAMDLDSKSSAGKETTMKVTILVKASMLTAALGLACLLPVTAHAQAEVAPDFYEMTGTELSGAAQTGQVAGKTQPAEFEGKFSLPYEVRCKGMALGPGKYSLAVKSEGVNRTVTIRSNGADMNLRVHVVSQNPARSQSAVLLRHAGRARTLEAVYVQQLNAILYFDSTSKANGNIGRTERLPIS
jgi:hypothetical protein